MKKIFTLLSICFSLATFAQTTMTVHTNNGATSFNLSDIDSITYNSSTNTDTYALGSTGPAGGIVFYDKGTYSNGWRYLEASNPLGQVEWGCSSMSVSGTQDVVGAGENNTNLIVNACSTPGIAAKICYNYTKTVNGIIYDDWFLPSIDELNLYKTAIVNNVSNNLEAYAYAWSSTEVSSSSSRAYRMRMNTGGVSEEDKALNYEVIAFRKF